LEFIKSSFVYDTISFAAVCCSPEYYVGMIKKMNKSIISLIAALLVGLTFIISGTGKVFWHESVSSQVVDFITDVVPEVFLTQTTVALLYDVFIPYVFPWCELIFGCLLLIGFVPRLIAILCIPLILVITSTNIWAIIKGSYATCASCFGFWEDIFGTLSPAQSLTIDIILLALVLVVLFLYPGGFLSSRAWLSRIINSKTISAFSQKVKQKTMQISDGVRKAAAGKSRVFWMIVICVTGVVLLLFGVAVLHGSRKGASAGDFTVYDVQIKNISETGAMISWTTEKPAQNQVMIYSSDGTFIQDVAEKSSYTAHLVAVGGLEPGTLYYFHIVTEAASVVFSMTSAYSFTTNAAAEVPFTISDIGTMSGTVSGMTVFWTTNKPSTGEVEYWKAGEADHAVAASSGDAATAHEVKLVDLKQGARYYYLVRSFTAAGKEEAESGQKTFVQAGGTDRTAAASDFELKSIDGRMVSLGDYKDKVVMLYFWQSSCSGCREKMAVIQGAVDRLPGDRAAILAIHVEGRESVIRIYAANENITVPVLLDLNRNVSRLYDVTGVPTLFFIDGDGVIRMKDVDFETPDELLAIFDSLIND